MITSARRARWILGLLAALLLLGAGSATAAPRPLPVPLLVTVSPAAGGAATRVAAAPGDAVLVSSGPRGRLSVRVVPTTGRALRVVDLAPVAIVVQVSRNGRPLANARLAPGNILVLPAPSSAE